MTEPLPKSGLCPECRLAHVYTCLRKHMVKQHGWAPMTAAERAEHQRQYNREHAAERAEYRRQYYREHAAERAEYQRQYYREHKKQVVK